MQNREIIVITCGHFEKNLTRIISKDIEKEFHFPVAIVECNLDLSGFYHPGRRQYDANLILKEIEGMELKTGLKCIALFRVDLFIPILTYIFGQASLGGYSGIVSLYRLRNELYGIEPDAQILNERFRKVILHELGHTFGLIHCQNPVCIMRSSTYVEDIDQKELKFCPVCSENLRRNQDEGHEHV